MCSRIDVCGGVDDTQVIVVKSADSLDDLRCGGTAMIALDAEKSPADIDPKFSDGTDRLGAVMPTLGVLTLTVGALFSVP